MKITSLLTLLFCLAGCNPQASFRTELDGGGVYNTNKEIIAFFESKLSDGSIHIGMSQSEFQSLCGSPAVKDRSVDGDANREVWRYGNVGVRSYRYGYKIYLFTFENGILKNWRG